jgi:hypothetical protein
VASQQEPGNPPRTSTTRPFPVLSREIVERLSAIRPATIGQAGRVSGVTSGRRGECGLPGGSLASRECSP